MKGIPLVLSDTTAQLDGDHFDLDFFRQEAFVSGDVYRAPIRRGNFVWHVASASPCKKYDSLGHCQLRIPSEPFRSDGCAHVMQLVIHAPEDGTVHIQEEMPNGWWSSMTGIALNDERANYVGATFEPSNPSSTTGSSLPCITRVVMGRRVHTAIETRNAFADAGTDLLATWWPPEAERYSSILSLGVCDHLGYFRGGRGRFDELFRTICGPVHITHALDMLVSPSCTVLLEQIDRTPAEREAIMRFWSKAASGIAHQEMTFVRPYKNRLDIVSDPKEKVGFLQHACVGAALLGNQLLQPSLLTTNVQRFALDGTRCDGGPPDAVILSPASETGFYFRHKDLGFSVSLTAARMEMSGLPNEFWEEHFEVISPSIERSRQSMETLVDRLSQQGTRVFFTEVGFGANRVYQYAALTSCEDFDTELSEALYDLAHEKDIGIIPTRKLHADLGPKGVPDGFHPTALMEERVRDLIVSALESVGIVSRRPV